MAPNLTTGFFQISEGLPIYEISHHYADNVNAGLNIEIKEHQISSFSIQVEDGSSCNKTTETLEEWMKPKIVAACNITQPGDPRGIVYVKSPIDKVEEKCTEAKTKCAKRTGNTRQTNRAIAENDYEEGSDGSNEEDNEVTGTMENCLSDIETKDMTVLKDIYPRLNCWICH